MILGEGDVDSQTIRHEAGVAKLQILPDSDNERRLTALLGCGVSSAALGGAARVRLKALTKSGWDVHLVHHKALEYILHYQPSRQPLAHSA